ncbi:MAG: O-antigen ligase family protein [Clostridia bacterium]|nr:O-antigen ligase family protein [Clostridia bacterium]MDE6472679.1 O-antigen ligase family protein [Clostridia bacterium]
MIEAEICSINKRGQKLEDLQKKVAYVLFSGVMLVLLQAFFCLALVGKVTNTVSNNSHFMHYSQMYFTFCSMLLTVFLVAYYIVKIYVGIEQRKLNLGKFIQDNLILLPFVFMLIWALISTYKSPYFEKSLYGAGYINEGYFTVLQYAVVFLSAYAIRDEIKWSKEAILWSFIVMAGVICIIFTGIEITNYKIPTSLKSGVFNNSNHYGYFLAMSSTATFGALVYSNRKWQMLLALLLLPFNVFQLLACNTLGANIAYICGIAFLICSGLITKKLDWKRLLVACALSGVVNFVFEVSGRTNMWSSYVELFKDVKRIISPSSGGGDSSGDNSSAGTGRFGLWKRTIAVIKQVPWFGKGLDLYHSNNIYDTSLDVSHNEYITMASNIGVPGFVMYFGTMIWWFVRAIRARKILTTCDLILLATTFAYLISAIFGNSFTYTYPYLMIFLAMSMQKPQFREYKYKILQESNSLENLLKI